MPDTVSREEFEKLQALVQNTRAQIGLLRLDLLKAGVICIDAKVRDVSVREILASQRLEMVANGVDGETIDKEIEAMRRSLEDVFAVA